MSREFHLIDTPEAVSLLPSQSRSTPWDRVNRISVFIVVILGALIINEYVLLSSNANMELPPVLAMLNPQLFQNDFYVQEMTGFTPRFYYNYLIYFPVKLGLSLPLTNLIFYLATFSAFLLGLFALGKQFTGSVLGGGLVAFLGLSGVGNGTIGHHALFWRSPYPYILAMGFVVWGVYFCFRKRWLTGYLLFGIAALLQFLVGVLPGALFLPLLFWEAYKRGRPGQVVPPLVILGLFAALVYVPMYLSGATSSNLLTDAQFVFIYGTVRTPHHIIPSSWSPFLWANYFLFTAGGILLLLKSPFVRKEDSFRFSVIIGGSLLAMVAGYLFVEVIPLALFAKLQLGRTTPFAQLTIFLALAIVASQFFRKGNWPLALLLIWAPILGSTARPNFPYGGIFLFVITIILVLYKPWKQKPTKGFGLLIGSLLAVVTVAYVLIPRPVSAENLLDRFLRGPVLFAIFLTPYFVERFKSRYRVVKAGVPVAALLTLLFFLLGAENKLPAQAAAFFNRRVEIYRIPDDNVAKIALEFKRLSPTEAVILTPPSIENFKLLAERSVVVDFQSQPFTDHGMIEWAHRIEDVLGKPLSTHTSWRGDLDGLYKDRQAAELVRVAQKYGASYILTRFSWHPNLPGEIVAKKGDWIIYKIGKSNG